MTQYKSLEIWKKVFEELFINDIQINEELFNREYEACSIAASQLHIKSRLANKTPNKKGYFVAVWKKDAHHKNVPFDVTDIKDFLVINIIDNEKRGQFIFDKETLIANGIISNEEKTGKMAFRLYPAWVQDLNQTAKKTQKWQSHYFIDLSDGVSGHEIRQHYKR